MTRLFRPPYPIAVRCTTEGRPVHVTGHGQARQVTLIAQTWAQHALPTGADGPGGDRVYYRVLLDGVVPWDIYQDGDGRWYLTRIIT